MKKIRSLNPDSKILWVWNMIKNDDQTVIMEKGIARYNSETGDKKAWGLKLHSMEEEVTDEDKGSRGHPGPLTHKNAAASITDFIKTH